MSKFAPITASLLARKGDAMPSGLVQTKPPMPWTAPPPPLTHERFAWSDNHPHELPHEHHDMPRRLFVALSHAEHERLAIAAVKKGITQHQIVHNALDAYFEKLSAEFDEQCACIANGGCRNGCAPD
jgi:hypothetical protein